MSFLTFLFSFLGMVILIPAICYGFFKLSILLKSNILSRGNAYYTLIRFEHLDSIPPLLDNPNFLKTGKWEYFSEANYFKGFSKLSDRELQNWIEKEYHLNPGQVLVTVPETMKVASAAIRF